MLAPVDRAALGRAAAGRPVARPQLAMRADRLQDPALRAAFALWRLSSAPRCLEPCQLCGMPTACFCEGCWVRTPRQPPVAICTQCDQEERVCHACGAAGCSWQAARAEHQRLNPAAYSGSGASSVAFESGAGRG
jgi:hypothetical protein